MTSRLRPAPDVETYQEIVRDLADARRALELSQAMLARKLGVAYLTLASWERGYRQPGAVALIMWARTVKRPLRLGGSHADQG